MLITSPTGMLMTYNMAYLFFSLLFIGVLFIVVMVVMFKMFEKESKDETESKESEYS